MIRALVMAQPYTLQWALPVVALFMPLLLYRDTAYSIVSLWDSSETYAHGYIILPVTLWLVWRQRENLIQLNPAPFWPAMLLLALCGLAWLLGELGGAQVVRQYAFVSMLPLLALALLGWQIARILAFPLLFMLLAVPFGDLFIEPLMNFTADFTVAALQASAIPVWREGNSFSLPSGSWSVVEACSGIRYLLASFTLGCLYAYLNYRSRLRQVLFILLSIIVPIIANSLRAYLIVLTGHLSGMKLAVGIDHLIYGWVFFGMVMFLLFWAGSRWREVQAMPVPAAAEKTAARHHSSASPAQLAAAALCAISCLALWPLYASYLARAGFNPSHPALDSFHSGWQVAAPFTTWRPVYASANAELTRYYRQETQQAGVAIHYYRNQHQGAELISAANRLVKNEDPLWNRLSMTPRNVALAQRTLAVRESRIDGGKQGALLVWHWYWVNGNNTSSEYLQKFWQASGKLLLQGDDGASLMIFAPYSEHPEEARKVLQAFLADNLIALETVLAANLQRHTR